jgi:hypothetical protein
MGSLVLIDSSYDELVDGINLDIDDNNIAPTIKFKLNGDVFEDDDKMDFGRNKLKVTDNITDDILIENFYKIFNPNVFTGEFTINGGIKPPQSIIDLISSINNTNYKNHLNKQNNIISIINAIENAYNSIVPTIPAIPPAIPPVPLANIRRVIDNIVDLTRKQLKLIPKIAIPAGNKILDAVIIAAAAGGPADIAARNAVLPANPETAAAFALLVAARTAAALLQNEPNEFLEDIILKNFSNFLHNKVGQSLVSTDYPQLYEKGYNLIDCRKGDMVSITRSATNFGAGIVGFRGNPNIDCWGIIYKINRDNNNNLVDYEIITKNPITHNLDIITEAIRTNIARLYGKIEQSYKPDQKLTSDEELLETYIVSY